MFNLQMVLHLPFVSNARTKYKAAYNAPTTEPNVTSVLKAIQKTITKNAGRSFNTYPMY